MSPCRRRLSERSIVLLGDSLVAGGRWSALLRSRRVANEGHPGYTTDELGEPTIRVAAARPRAVIVMSGTNDIRDGHGPAWTGAALEAILDRLDADAPDAEVVVQSILPRSPEGELVLATNVTIERLATARGVRYLDLHPHFDRGDGRLRDGETTDGIHLSRAGYRRWADLLRPTVRELTSR